MPDLKELNSEALEFFRSLPPMIQEQIMQGAAKLTTKAELESYYTNILRKGGEK